MDGAKNKSHISCGIETTSSNDDESSVKKSVIDAVAEHNDTDDKSWEFFYEEASQLEYDEDELFFTSSIASTPNGTVCLVNADGGNVSSISLPTENSVGDEQLLIEGRNDIGILCIFVRHVCTREVLMNILASRFGCG